MNIILNHSSMLPIYEQIIGQIKSAIVSGEYESGAMLPSVRALASELQISALTVKKAYDKLEEDGILVTVHGKGSFVAGNLESLAAEEAKRKLESDLSKSVAYARANGISSEEIMQLMEIILEG